MRFPRVARPDAAQIAMRDSRVNRRMQILRWDCYVVINSLGVLINDRASAIHERPTNIGRSCVRGRRDDDNERTKTALLALSFFLPLA